MLSFWHSSGESRESRWKTSSKLRLWMAEQACQRGSESIRKRRKFLGGIPSWGSKWFRLGNGEAGICEAGDKREESSCCPKEICSSTSIAESSSQRWMFWQNDLGEIGVTGGNGMIWWLRRCTRGSTFRSKSRRLRESLRLRRVFLVRFGEHGGTSNPILQHLPGDLGEESNLEITSWCL